MKKNVTASSTGRHRTATRRFVACAATAGLFASFGVAAAAPASAASVSPSLSWEIVLSSKPVALSSPMVATLDGGGQAILIGDRSGHEYAIHISNHSEVAGWPSSTGGVAVDSTASVLGSGAHARIFFGEGTSSNPGLGSVRALNNAGGRVWDVVPKGEPSGGKAGVMSSVSIGHIQSSADVVSGNMGQLQYVISSGGRVATGFPWFEADSNFSTPALSDPTNSGHDEIIEGGDSTHGTAFGWTYSNGGHIRILKNTGNYKTGHPYGGLKCQYNTNQVVQSSPAVGKFLSNGNFGIVTGTGSFYSGASDTGKVYALDNNCKVAWKASLSGSTGSSPALADVTGSGKLDVVEGTKISASSGRVYALSGSSGKVIWQTAIPGGVYGGVTTADLSGQGYQDVIVPTPTGAYVLDGKTGKELYRLGAGYGFQNNALVTHDADGTIGITLAGYNGKDQGVLMHYSMKGTNGALANISGAWPMFHHDQNLTGDASSAVLNPNS